MICEILKMNNAVDSISVESLMDPLNLVQSENMKCASYFHSEILIPLDHLIP